MSLYCSELVNTGWGSAGHEPEAVVEKVEKLRVGAWASGIAMTDFATISYHQLRALED